MSGWLDPVRRVLDGVAAPVTVFCRDDDAGWDDEALWPFLDVVGNAGASVDVATIPAAVTPGTAAGLARFRTDGVARVHQHGYAHLDHEVVGRRCEFGPSRAAAAQRADLAAGRTRLLEAFAGVLEPVFTPPWNRCTVGTAEALRDLGVLVLSREWGAEPFGLPGVAEVPVTLDWAAHRKRVPLSRPEWAGELAAQLGAGGPVGLMFHHATLTPADRVGIGQVLDLLWSSSAVRPASIVSAVGARTRERPAGDPAGRSH